MTKDDKKILLYFITLTGMYIHPQDTSNVVSFITGYEIGRKTKCDFAQLSKQLLSEKYKIKCSSDGWSGQMKRLSEKFSISWKLHLKKLL